MALVRKCGTPREPSKKFWLMVGDTGKILKKVGLGKCVVPVKEKQSSHLNVEGTRGVLMNLGKYEVPIKEMITTCKFIKYNWPERTNQLISFILMQCIYKW